MTRLLLALETSCDETAAAVISEDYEVRSSVVASQIDLHAEFGGVVPELASRAHVELITPIVTQALAEAGISGTELERGGRHLAGRDWSVPFWSGWPRPNPWPWVGAFPLSA